MTTFQTLIEAFLSALPTFLPFSTAFARSVFEALLHWPVPGAEIQLLVFLVASIVFLIQFRYDWLGIFSALIRSLLNPGSLHPGRRTLDQHVLLFLLIVFLPNLLASLVVARPLEELEWSGHPVLLSVLSFALGGFLRASFRWNKRINGLNHLNLSHAVLISAIGVLSVHPGLPLAGLLWIGFAFCNYHYEAILKYSMLLLGMSLFARTGIQLADTGLSDAISRIGPLNAVAAVAVLFTVFWIGIENLQKNLSENTYQSFLWISSAIGIFFLVVHFFLGN